MISIVDDDLSVREATLALVRSLGYAAQTFCSAEEFLASGHVNRTSCLITDVHMIGLSGVELQRRLIASGHDVPVIFLTASTDEKIRRRALSEGAIRFLGKPFSDRLLVACLDEAFRKSVPEARHNPR